MSDRERFIVINKCAEVDPCYGLYEFELSQKDIEALSAGKKLYGTVSCDEYAITIQMEEAADEN